MSIAQPMDESYSTEWIEALCVAEKALQEPPAKIGLSAIIVATEDPAVTLPDGLEFNGLRLFPSDEPYRFNPVSARRSLRPVVWVPAFPVVVHAHERNYSGGRAEESAARRINDLCALLTAESGVCWRLVESPVYELLDPEDFLGGVGRWSGESLRRPLAQPRWWTRQSTLLGEHREWLMDRIRTFHQGVQLSGEFPSWANIAFASVIEQFGGKFDPTIPEQKFAAKAFRTGYGLNMENRADKELYEFLYASRNETAHEGGLVGGEGAAGVGVWINWFEQSTAEKFRFDVLIKIRHKCRELIKSELNLIAENE